MQIASYIALYCAVVAKVCLLLFLLRQRSCSEMPRFTAFAAVLAAAAVTLRIVQAFGSEYSYFIVYWSVEGLLFSAMAFAVIDLVREVCLPGRMISWRVMRIYVNAVIIAALTIYIVAHIGAPTRFPILNALMAIERSAAWITAATIGLLTVYTGIFDVRWRRHARLTAVGIVCVVLPAMFLARAEIYFPGVQKQLFAISSSAFDVLACAIWTAAYWRPVIPESEPETGKVAVMEEMLDVLGEYEEQMERAEQ